jgi:hypothetical protein
MYDSVRNEVCNLCDSAQGTTNISAEVNAPGRRSTAVFEPRKRKTNGVYDLIRQSIMNLYRPVGAWHIL